MVLEKGAKDRQGQKGDTVVWGAPPSFADYDRSRGRLQGSARPTSQASPLVSVVTVVFNGMPHIEAVLDNVAREPYENLEHIVIDGGSTDGTVELLRTHERLGLFWMSEPDDGIFDAFNKGIAIAGGQLIKLLNADDLLVEGCVQKAVTAYLSEETKDVVIFGDITLIGTDGTDLGLLRRPRRTSPIHPVLHPSWFVSHTTYERHGLYRPEFTTSGDFEFFLRLRRKHVPFVDLCEPVTLFRFGGVSTATLAGNTERLRILRQYFPGATAVRYSLASRLKKRRSVLLRTILPKKTHAAVRRRFRGTRK